jgi:hypothetical protein
VGIVGGTWTLESRHPEPPRVGSGVVRGFLSALIPSLLLWWAMLDIASTLLR